MGFLPKSFVDAICAEVEELVGDKPLADFEGTLEFEAREEGGAVLVKAVLNDVDEVGN